MRDKILNSVWSLYQTRLKHSTQEKDLEKLEEEVEELRIATFDESAMLDNAVMEESADVFICLMAQLAWVYQPSSIMDLGLILDNWLDWIDDKTERTKIRFENGFYNK